MIGKTISHYKIIEKLGSGGMGDVYKAEDLKLKRLVALKFLPPELTRDEEARKRFLHEAQVISMLDHPNIGTIYEINESDGNVFIAMAYYEGETLKDRLESHKAGMDIKEAVDITIQILSGLAKAHSNDIIHRDVKPANILLTKDGNVKIVDFGLAKLKGLTMLTKSGATMGTVAYMSPEQAQGENVDHRTDIWSVGVMLYEMLAGKKPFNGEHEQALMYLILNEKPEFISKLRKDVPLPLEKILEKALEKNPDKRYQTIEEMLEELNAFAEEYKEGLSKTTSIFKLGRKQRKLVFRGAAIFILAAVIGMYFWQSIVSASQPASIVLLPLKSITPNAEEEWFTDGMTDALITDLAKISGFRIISLASAMKYKGTKKAPQEIASELGVDYVIEGSISKIGNQVKILARLIDAPKNEYLWAEKYERDFRDVLGLQGELAQVIASRIKVELTPQEKTRLTTNRSVNPEIYELYLKGMYHLNKYTPDGINLGLSYLHQAVKKDSTNALTYAGLALAYDIIAHTPSPPPEATVMARTYTKKALDLDENSAEAHLALAMVRIYGDRNKSGAEQSFKRALELNPSLVMAHAHYAWFLELSGSLDDALSEMKKAQRLDPLSPVYHAWEGWMCSWEGLSDRAIKKAHESLELNPELPVALYVLGCGYAAKGMFEKAIEVHVKAGELGPDWKFGLGQTYALAGLIDEAHEVTAELEKQTKLWYAWGLAEIYAALGEKDEAFRSLENALVLGHPYMPWLMRNGNFKPLHDDPRFNDLVRRSSLPK